MSKEYDEMNSKERIAQFMETILMEYTNSSSEKKRLFYSFVRITARPETRRLRSPVSKTLIFK